VVYILVEFVKGSLPWRRLKDKDKVGEMKLSCTSAEFLKGLPPELNTFIEYLQSLQFQDQPDYSYLKSLLHQAIRDLGGNDNSPFPWENTTPPPWVLSTIPSPRASRSEVTEISTRTPSRDYSRGGTADLMATSDSHEKSTEYRLINRENEVVKEIVPPLPSSPRLLSSGSNSALPDTKHQPNTNVELDVGGDVETDIKCGFVELDLSEKTKNFDHPRPGRRRIGGKLKKHHKDSSKSVSSSKKRKKQQEHVQGSENTGSKCGCNLL